MRKSREYAIISSDAVFRASGGKAGFGFAILLNGSLVDVSFIA